MHNSIQLFMDKKERKLLYCEGKLERQGKQGEHYYLQFIDGTDL